MKRPSVLIFLISAFVGGNLLMGIASNPRSVKNSTGTPYTYMQQIIYLRSGNLPVFPLITFVPAPPVLFLFSHQFSGAKSDSARLVA